MARKKTITKKQILRAAYTIVATEGFSNFTARRVASKMKCSTQPIYLEFQNMSDLRKEVLNKINERLEQEIYSRVILGDAILDLSIAYVEFAINEPTMYRAIYTENYPESHYVVDYGRRLFMQNLNKDLRYRDLEQSIKDSLFTQTWLTATGIATLSSGNLYRPSREELVKAVNGTIRSILEKDDYYTQPA